MHRERTGSRTRSRLSKPCANPLIAKKRTIGVNGMQLLDSTQGQERESPDSNGREREPKGSTTRNPSSWYCNAYRDKLV